LISTTVLFADLFVCFHASLILDTTTVARLGPPCTRGDGTPDWGPQRGPRWNDCSKEESPTQAPSSLNNANGVSSYESYVDANGNTVYAGQGADSAGGKFSNAAAGLSLWMVFVAGSVMSALVAVHLGQKKDSVGEGRHGMSGAIMRRKGAVGAFADGVFPSRGKEVEMKSSSRPEYRLDMSEQV
jgi:hypothetical protein